MLPITSGKTLQEYVSPIITFNPQTNQFLVNNQLNLGFTSSRTKPTNPEVGDKWYDTSTDIIFEYVYDGLSYNWIDVSGASVGAGGSNRYVAPVVIPPVLINYIIVAGGGSGAYGGPAVTNGGGGGGGVLIGSTLLGVSPVTYPITVGLGGFLTSGGPPSTFSGQAGNSSTALSLTAFGGGQGGPGGSPGQPGGSGGGGSSYCYSGPAGKPGGTGTPGQGFPGGTGTCTPGLPVPAAGKGGGGGGAGLAGKPGALAGTGGCGLLWPFTNSYYGGGGGGGYALAGPGTGGAGGLGGGAPGDGNSANTMGQVFTGGGGGGSTPSRNVSGGPGIVAIAVSTPSYPQISIPAAQISSGNVVVSTPPAAPGYTVASFRYPGCFSIISSVPPAPYSGAYLIVGGGGSGGSVFGGGGGAGGFITGTQTFTPGTSYPIVVGAGGTAVNPGPAAGNPGNPSSFLSLTAVGGGGGGAFNSVSAIPGGSGGGACGAAAGCTFSPPGGLGTNFPGPTMQGSPGGRGFRGSVPGRILGGGGGGISGSGTDANTTTAGTGGFGSVIAQPLIGWAGGPWPYTNQVYAGGGGGGAGNGTPVGLPGLGRCGGGAGGNTNSFSATAGTPGTGSGGGGGGTIPAGANVGGAGGPGVVVIAIPTAVYPTVSAPGAVVTTSPLAPGFTVLTYNTPASANTSYTFTA
jgi:hypothetical protein